MTGYEWTLQNKASLPWGRLVRLGDITYRVESHSKATGQYRFKCWDGPMAGFVVTEDSDGPIMRKGEIVHPV
jgi:hypothetical protein